MPTVTKTSKRAAHHAHHAVGETVGVRVAGKLRSGRVVDFRSSGNERMVTIEMITAMPEDALVLELPERWVVELVS